MQQNKDNNIVFFDGVCSLCNGVVDFIMKRDKKKVFRFTSLQSEYSKENLKNIELDTIVYISNEKIYTKSKAVLEILSTLGGLWKLSLMLKLIPSFILDIGYDLISKNRYVWFKKKDTCRIPTKEEKERFL
jgi:predicted DCC family thiol-disulfide oxidoreductase YuxK